MFLSRQNAEPHPSTLLASLLALLLYDRLLFDIHNPASSPILLGVRIYEELADDLAAEQRSESFLADRKLLLIPGMNHVEVKLTLGAGETRLIEIEQQHEEARP